MPILVSITAMKMRQKVTENTWKVFFKFYLLTRPIALRYNSFEVVFLSKVGFSGDRQWRDGILGLGRNTMLSTSQARRYLGYYWYFSGIDGAICPHGGKLLHQSSSPQQRPSPF
ncbi:hypothetical protein ACLOJK_041695 [Asimina triloba]